MANRQLGVYDPETAKTILGVVNYLKANGFVVPVAGRGQQTITPPTPIYVRNDSGEEAPAFACMQVTGTVEVGGQNYIKVDQPSDVTGDAGGYLFNGIAPIADGDYGIAYDGPVARMLTDGSTITCGDAWQPQVNDWEVTTGGSLFTAIGADDIETNVMRAGINAGGSSSKIFKATSGIAARSGTTISGATCTEFKNVSGTLTTNTTTQTVYNLSAVAVPSNGYVIGHKEAISNVWVCEPAIVGLRLSGSDFQYTIDGTTWTTWETGTACP